MTTREELENEFRRFLYTLNREDFINNPIATLRDTFKAGQINGIRVGFEKARESEFRKEEGGEYLRDKYESVEELFKELDV